jgi:ABC-type amino acid transport substrate-binding protein
MKRHPFTLGLLVLLLAPGLSLPAYAGHLAEVQERGKLTLLCFPTTRGTHAFVKLDRLAQAGKPLAEIRDPDYFAGFEVDLVKRFADEMGVALEVKAITTTYKDLVQALVDGEGDLIASSLTVTEARDRIVDFSTPFTFGHISVIVPRDSQVSTLEDLRGLKGAVMEGSSQQEALEKLGIEGMELRLTDFSMENLAEVEEGRADFTLIDTALHAGDAPAPDSPGLKVAFHLQRFGNAFAIPEGSDLAGPLNAFVERMLARGEVRRLMALYDGEGPAEP